jgi:hypothetical protein
LISVFVFVVMPRVDMYGFFGSMVLHFTLRWMFSTGNERFQSANGASIWIRHRLALLERSPGGKLFLDASITILFLFAMVVLLWVGHYLKGHR